MKPTLEIQNNEKEVTALIRGELTARHAREFKNELIGFSRIFFQHQLTVRFEGIVACDVSAVQMILAFKSEMEQRNIKMFIDTKSDRVVNETLEITGTTNYL